MKTLQTGNDKVNPAGSGWLGDLLTNVNRRMTERIGKADEAGDIRQVNFLLLEQGRLNLSLQRPYWPSMPYQRRAGV